MSDPKMTTIKTQKCFMCGETGEVEVPADEWALYMKSRFDDESPNRFIQTALKSVEAPLREQLMTGTHPACWDKMFAGSEF